MAHHIAAAAVSIRTISSLPCTAEEATKAATAAPSRDTTVLMTQLNCWKGPGASVPGVPACVRIWCEAMKSTAMTVQVMEGLESCTVHPVCPAEFYTQFSPLLCSCDSAISHAPAEVSQVWPSHPAAVLSHLGSQSMEVPEASAPLKLGQKIQRKMVPIMAKQSEV